MIELFKIINNIKKKETTDRITGEHSGEWSKEVNKGSRLINRSSYKNINLKNSTSLDESLDENKLIPQLYNFFSNSFLRNIAEYNMKI